VRARHSRETSAICCSPSAITTNHIGVAWADNYPKLGEFRDSDGRAPRHGFFFPGEEYKPYYLDRLGELARAGFGEVEFHLHHDGDTAETLAPRIREHIKTFAEHGHISRDKDGNYQWAFIHGNWSLANGRPDAAGAASMTSYRCSRSLAATST
jgi:hypothetical protein